MTLPKILALDFDGVICNGLKEYFQISRLTYEVIWGAGVDDSLVDRFYTLRPVIETGWEMPLLLRAIELGVTDEAIFSHWPDIAANIVRTDDLDRKTLSKTLDGLRDKWIANDLEGWLSLHSFYPGVIDRLARFLASDLILYIITTKEGRFVKRLLQEVNINFPDEYLIGKEAKKAKYISIREIINNSPEKSSRFWFVEDRLDALELVKQQEDLGGVGLFLADWGYNTKEMRDSIVNDTRIELLSLEQFAGELSGWTR